MFLRHVIDDQNAGKCLSVFKSLEFCGHQLRPHFELRLVFMMVFCWNQAAQPNGPEHFGLLHIYPNIFGPGIIDLRCITNE